MSTNARHLLVGLLVVLALAGAGYWLVENTEWREETVPAPLKGEARTDALYAAARLVEQLGARVVKPNDFSTLPPPHAVLLLTSEHWNLFAGRTAALRGWVESGGRLVLPEHVLDTDEDLEDWVGITSRFHRARENEREKADREDDDTGKGPGVFRRRPPVDRCARYVERGAVPATAGGEAAADSAAAVNEQRPETPSPASAGEGWGEGQGEGIGPRRSTPHIQADRAASPRMLPVRDYRVCETSRWHTLEVEADPAAGIARNWSLESDLGPIVLRVTAGRGSVTVLNDDRALRWRAPLEADNAKFLVAVTQLAAGDEVWFVSREDADALPALMWRLGWPVIVLLAAALVIALWRDMARFGPVAATPPPARRSLAEQIRGTAEFLLRYRRGAALLAAQLRALDEAAARSIRGWQALSEKARVAALAQATHVDAAALAQARALPASAQRIEFAHAIALLEGVRRRLAAQRPRTGANF